jgi:hypothetical protein
MSWKKKLVSYGFILASISIVLMLVVISGGGVDAMSESLGSQDMNFYTTGKATTPVGKGNDIAYAVVIQSDGSNGKIMSPRDTSNGSNYDSTLNP